MISLDEPLDTERPEGIAFLRGLQGNILKSHGRDFATHVFVTFGPGAEKARAWLADFAKTRVTSATRQKRQRDAWVTEGGAGELFASLLLSYSGYLTLGVPESSIPTDASGSYFQLGMKRQAEAPRPFNDPPSEQWMEAFKGRPDAVIILAHDDGVELSQAVTDLRKELEPCTTTIWVEEGSRLTFNFPGRAEVTIEHFGFEDGISNPLFYVDDIEQERAWRGATKWDPAAPLKLALTAEPHYPDRYGSFFVFRKLEQNVAGFKQALVELAKELGPGDPERAGAMAVGRFRDGSSIVAAPAPDPSHGQNDFYFKTDDAAGAICPFHAHIRKTNPRGDTPLPPERERMFRVVRRGITYGARPDLAPGSALPPPSSDVGLLFMCYQAQLEQFAIQQEGSDSNDFIGDGVGVDAVIGQNATPSPQEWPAGSGRRFTMANFVKLLGGEYFFAPSIAFLRNLDKSS